MDKNISKSAMVRHIDTMVMFLNTFPKENVSQFTVKKLHILYKKLSDYLNQNSAKQALKASKNIDTQSIEFSEDISYVCGICNEKIKIYNSDHGLSVSLHAQEDVHKKALKQQGEKQSNTEEIARPTSKLNEKQIKKQEFIYKIRSGGSDYYCRLCDVRLNSVKSRRQHEAGILHQDSLSSSIQTQLAPGIVQDDDVDKVQTKSNKHVKRIPEIVFSKNNAYLCNFCNVILGTSINNVIQHKYSRAHQDQLNSSGMNPVSDHNFWCKISGDIRKQRIHFETITDNTVFCKLCKVSVYRYVNSVKEHINGIFHNERLKS